MTFTGKTAIVTGGTGALGSVVAKSLFDAGAAIAIPYNSEKSLHNIPKAWANSKDRVLLTMTDITAEEQVQRFTDEVVKRFKSVDFLVNAAGGYIGGSTIDEVMLNDWDSIIKLNLTSAFLMCRNALRVMRKRKSGRIINIASMPAVTPSAKKGPYSISKRGVITLTETIAEEVKGSGITANAIAPSIIVTQANKESMPNSDHKKWVTPEEIADLIVYLCSDEARSINGNVIKIYGGV